MTVFITEISSAEASNVVDNKTVTLKSSDGVIITLNFATTAAMKSVADKIKSALASPAPAVKQIPTTAPEDKIVVGDPYTPLPYYEESDEDGAGNETEIKEGDESEAKGTVSESDSVTQDGQKEEVDSSFESLGDVGFTQELF